MADQNLNLNLTVNSTQYVQGVSAAASKTGAIGAAAAHRANGGKTERPMDWNAAMEQLG